MEELKEVTEINPVERSTEKIREAVESQKKYIKITRSAYSIFTAGWALAAFLCLIHFCNTPQNMSQQDNPVLYPIACLSRFFAFALAAVAFCFFYYGEGIRGRVHFWILFAVTTLAIL